MDQANNPTLSSGAKSAWSRRGLNLRLTKARRSYLQSLTSGMPPGTTPTEAVDEAIRIGLAKRDPSDLFDVDLDDINESIKRMSLEFRADIRSLSADVDDMSRRMIQLSGQVGLLLAQIQRISVGDDNDGYVAAGPPPAISAWLDREALRRGVKMERVAMASAKWVGTMAGTAFMSMDWDVDLMRADEATLPKLDDSTATVRMELIAMDSPLAGADLRSGSHFLVCRRSANGAWHPSVWTLGADGKSPMEISANAQT